jgi:hypothetical protein
VILTCAGFGGPPTYMVTVLRTHDAPPLWCEGHAHAWPPAAAGASQAGGSGDAFQKWTGMGGSARLGDVGASEMGCVDPL